MHEPGAILLVACYELGHQPLGVSWPAAFLEAAGYRPAVLDVSVEPFDPERAARARVVVIAVPMHTALRLGVGVVERVRAVNRTAHVCFHGLYAALNADALFALGADSIVAGEGEATLVALVRALEAGDDRLPPGVRTRSQAAGPIVERLAFPVPSRGKLPPLARYARLEREGRLELVAAVETSRGCKHRCRHCPIPPVYGGRFVAVPLPVCLADIRQAVAAGARHITFADPDFLNGPGHAFRVVRALHAEFPAVTFDFTAKVEHLLRHRERLGELRALGGAFVVSAVESLSDAVLGHLDKGHTRADVHAIVRVTREAGLPLRPTWVAFTPWTTLDDYREMLDFIEAEALVDAVDAIQLSLRLLVPPGSLLLDSSAMRPYLGALEPGTFQYRWTHPDPRMDGLQAAVAETVSRATAAGESAPVPFDRVRQLASTAAGAPPRASLADRLPASRHRPPRLTESWFC